METIVIVRERGQITIPYKIRKKASWARPMSVVSIKMITSDSIIITTRKREMNWENLLKDIKVLRAMKGRGKVLSAAEFLEKDRQSH